MHLKKSIADISPTRGATGIPILTVVPLIKSQRVNVAGLPTKRGCALSLRMRHAPVLANTEVDFEWD